MTYDKMIRREDAQPIEKSPDVKPPDTFGKPRPAPKPKPKGSKRGR